jgi:hypothetical protein
VFLAAFWGDRGLAMPYDGFVDLESMNCSELQWLDGIMSASGSSIMAREVRIESSLLRSLVHWTREQDDNARLCVIHTQRRATDCEFSANRFADLEISA